jgi:hypothetical protein
MGQTSEGAKRAAKTRRKKYGSDHFRTIGSMGIGVGGPRHFARLKNEDPEKLRQISVEAAHKGVRHFAQLKKENPEEHKKISAKGGKNKLPKRPETPIRGSTTLTKKERPAGVSEE